MKQPPKPPKQLRPAVAAAWKMFCAQIGDVKPSDHAALEMLSQAWATMSDAQAKLDGEGVVVKLPNTFLAMNPWAKVLRESRAVVVRLCNEFHLTPASRDKMGGDAGLTDELPAI